MRSPSRKARLLLASPLLAALFTSLPSCSSDDTAEATPPSSQGSTAGSSAGGSSAGGSSAGGSSAGGTASGGDQGSGGATGGAGGASGDGSVTFPKLASLSLPAGKGSFRFGAATAATQIEDQNTNTDWWVFTAQPPEGLGKGKAPVGNATKGFSKAIEDIEIVKAMGLDTYRFSIEWARIEPERDKIDEDAIAHYRQFIVALKDAGIRPHLTVHHFSNPIWIDDPRDIDCKDGPTDKNLCGPGHPQGGPLVIAEHEQHAKLLAERFGDLVDDWGTLNEPVNYLLAGYLTGTFPPGKNYLNNLLDKFVPVVRDYLEAHSRMYAAIKAADTTDADGDGEAASVGLSLSVAEWIPAAKNQISDDPVDIEARDKVVYVYHHLVADALTKGGFDPDLDGTLDEDHPSWKGTLDWLGVQYYFRAGVTGNGVIPVLKVTPCFGNINFGSCIKPIDPTYCVKQMKYEYHPEGLYTVLKDYGTRYPDLPLAVTEGGLATDVGKRRAENVVRSIEQIVRARDEGIDVRGYYHWSLYDNFEWVEGFDPHFGLYSVDLTTYERKATEGADVYGQIAKSRVLSAEHRKTYGGSGPMTPDPEEPMPEDCTY